jgi:type VI secretion system protein ImpF
MSRVEANQGLMPSILDRLIDPESSGTVWRRGYGLEQMMDSVRRDLEELLNTRSSLYGISEDYAETMKSVANYGLPDLTSFNAVTQAQREDVGRAIELVVSRFEPRLKDVRAHLLDPGNSRDRSVRFHIDARLSVEPAPEVAFDTVLELTTGRYTIKQSES